jgi:endothelin-converting enzyme/putative endopeptidase
MKTKSKRKAVTKRQNNNKTKRKHFNLVNTPTEKKECTNIGLESFESDLDKDKIITVKTQETKKQQFAKQLVALFSPKSIKPENDYYSYINYTWVHSLTVENKLTYLTKIDEFRLAQDNVYKQLNNIIETYISNNNNKLSHNLNAYYKSCTRLITVDYCRKISKETLEQIDELRKDKNNLWKMLAWINRDETISDYAPFVWKIQEDEKNPGIFRCNINPINFPIVDLSVYYDDGTNVEYKKKYRQKFLKFVTRFFQVTIPNDKKLSAQDVFDVHRDIFNVFGCKDIRTQKEDYYKVFANDSLSKYGFNWKEFSKELGFDYTPSFYITSNLNYLKCCSNLLLENWNSEKWRTYWFWIFTRRNIRITKKFEPFFYGFNGEFQRGQKQTVTDTEFNYINGPVFMSIPFNHFLTTEYIKNFKNIKFVKYVEVISEELKKVFIRIVSRNSWLTPKTKKYALLKLKHLKFIVGYLQRLGNTLYFCKLSTYFHMFLIKMLL